MATDESAIPVLSVETKILLQKLKIWEKIASGQLHSIALTDVQALYDILDPGEKGYITTAECFALQQVQNIKISRRLSVKGGGHRLHGKAMTINENQGNSRNIDEHQGKSRKNKENQGTTRDVNRKSWKRDGIRSFFGA